MPSPSLKLDAIGQAGARIHRHNTTLNSGPTTESLVSPRQTFKSGRTSIIAFDSYSSTRSQIIKWVQ